MYHYLSQSASPYSSMSISGIQGQLLEITVVGCNRLKDTEWISRQDPYVCVEYGSTKRRTRTCTDGGKNPVFQEKFVFTLIEGLREVNIVVWNSNTLSLDDFIGMGKVPLQKVLSQGFDDSAWPLQTKSGRHAGDVRLIMHYSNGNKPTTSLSQSAPPMHVPQAPHYAAPPPASAAPYPPMSTAHPTSSAYPSPYPPSSYPPQPPSAYPPSPYPPPSTYPPSSYPPPSTYPPSPYPPPPQASSYFPPGHYPGQYPPPPY